MEELPFEKKKKKKNKALWFLQLAKQDLYWHHN